MPASVTHLYRYPFKGMSPEPLQTVALTPNDPIPFDRAFAFAHEATEFDPNNPQHLNKDHFLVLKNNEKLATLRSQFEVETGTFQIYLDDELRVEANLQRAEGQATVARFLQAYLGEEVKGLGHVVHAPNHSISDTNARVLSFINLASVRALGEEMGETLDPLRFRANLYFDGLPAWSEFEWSESIQVGEVRFRVHKPTSRCAATNVNPSTAERDLQIPRALHYAYGHRNLGMYLWVDSAGEVAVGDSIQVD